MKLLALFAWNAWMPPIKWIMMSLKNVLVNIIMSVIFKIHLFPSSLHSSNDVDDTQVQKIRSISFCRYKNSILINFWSSWPKMNNPNIISLLKSSKIFHIPMKNQRFLLIQIQFGRSILSKTFSECLCVCVCMLVRPFVVWLLFFFIAIKKPSFIIMLTAQCESTAWRSNRNNRPTKQMNFYLFI